MIRHVVRIAMERIGMFVLDATDGEQAHELSLTFAGAIHVLVSDVIMPNLNGLGLCGRIQGDGFPPGRS